MDPKWPENIPEPTYPEYRLVLVWRADQMGNGIRTYLYREGESLQASWHPTRDLQEALEQSLSNYFEGRDV